MELLRGAKTIEMRAKTAIAILIALTTINIAKAEGVVERIQAKYGDSQPVCSFAVRDMFNIYFDTEEINGMVSNDMVRYWASEPTKWLSVEMQAAQEIANLGYFVVSGWENKEGGLGHVSVIVPGQEVEGRWCGEGTMVPVAMDTGRNRRETSIGINWCYSRDKQPDVQFFYYYKAK